MLITSLLYLFYYYFFNFTLQKCAIDIWQDFFRSVSVHELLCAIVFFSHAVSSPLTNTSMVLAPVIVQSFDCNYALYKTETSQRRTTDTFETINGQLRSALGSEKYRKTEMQVHCMTIQIAIRVGKLHTQIQYSSSYRAYLLNAK